MNTETPVTLKLEGADLFPHDLRSGDLATVITALEAAVGALVQDEAPAVKADQTRLSLVAVEAGSTTLAFTPNIEALAVPAVQRLIDAVNRNDFVGFPVAAVNGLRKIVTFVHKRQGSATLAVTHNAVTTQAAITGRLRLNAARITGITTLYGRVMRVGGVDPRVEFQPATKGRTLFCRAEREVVLALSEFLYQTVAVRGVAEWDAASLDVTEFTIEEWYRYEPTSPVEAFAELREKFGKYFDAIPDVDAWVGAVRRGEM